MGLTKQHTVFYKSISSLLLIVFILLVNADSQSQELKKVVDLQGYWKFTIGDDPEWSNPDYDDSHWEKIHVPGSWEEQGFHGYDGFAWYRTTVTLPSEMIHATYYLKLGYIDDVDEVFINGKKIGHTGQFPPDYSTAFNANRLYIIPHKLDCYDGSISIAVRVFDEGGEGGFIHGDISVVADVSSILTDFDLQGEWKFKIGDCSGIPDAMDYQSWDEISVPGPWEDQGYKGYDGFACYVTEFELDGLFTDQRVVLILGRIDDLDKVYLNGVLIGQSGPFSSKTVWLRSDVYKQIRGYYIPPELLKDNGKNTLVVKVLDVGGLGGIWDGTIGLISQDNYIQYWRNKRNSIR